MMGLAHASWAGHEHEYIQMLVYGHDLALEVRIEAL